MHFLKNFANTNRRVLVSGRSPNAGTSGTSIKNLNNIDNLLNYGTFATGTVSLSSSNQANDIAAGTGARKIGVFGLDENGLPQYEEINTHATDGRTAVTGIKQFSAVFGAEVLLAGSTFANVGDIYVYTTGTTIASGIPSALTTTWVKILATEGSSQNGYYKVPANKTANILDIVASNRSQIATIGIWIRPASVGSLENIFSFSMPATSPVLSTNILRNSIELQPLTEVYLRITPATTLAIANANIIVDVK